MTRMIRRIVFILLAILISFPSKDFVCYAQSALLTHHLRPEAQTGKLKAMGQLSATQNMRLVLTLPLRNEADLDTFLKDVYDPSSPVYRHYLTVDEFTAKYGPTQSDYNAVIQFAKQNGLAVVGTSRNRINVDVEGSVANIDAAFQVTMNTYQHPTENRTFYAPDKEPTINLPVQLWHISGLDNYSIPRPSLVKNPAALSNATSGVSPSANVGSGPAGSFLGSDMRAAYYGGTALTGAGQSVGLLEFAGTDLADLNTYFSSIGQMNTVPITVKSVDGTNPSCVQPCDDLEQTIDMTQAIGMAPGLSSLVVYVGSSDAAIFNAMATASPLNSQLSISWVWGPADASVDYPYFKEFAAQGQNVFAAAGDWNSWPNNVSAFPADDPYVTGVGGTDLQTATAGGAWSAETAWSASGGGIGPNDFPIPSWQVVAASNCTGCSTVYRNGPDVAANANWSFYVCANQSGCTSNMWGGTSFAAPMWAGYMALINQQAVASGSKPMGFLNPTLYAIAQGGEYDLNFHDITSGSNGYSATVGYDLVTGLGSPNGASLINSMTGTTPPPPDLAINAGGGVSQNFAGDIDYSGGNVATTPASIDTSQVVDAAPASVYQSERNGAFTYTIPNLTPGQSYAVRLHFAEFYWTKPGQRLFNVTINGVQVLTNFDIIAAAGGTEKAVVQQFPTVANANGQVVIQFSIGSADQPKISGIEIVSGVPTPPLSDVLAINSSGPTVGSFQADTDFIGGGTFSTTATVDTSTAIQPAPEAVYQSQRLGVVTYTIPDLTPGQSYWVRMHFAELYWTKPGQRMFNASINGQQVLNQFDIIGASGAANRANSQQFPTTANASGQIIVQLTAGTADQPAINGLEILANGADPDVAAIHAGGGSIGAFSADMDYLGGGAFTTTNTIDTSFASNPAPAALYQSERAGASTYTIPNLIRGQWYMVRLHFAEFYWTKPGQRMFNVSINGQQVLTNYDIIATTGAANRANVQQFKAAANGYGQIVIQLTNGSADQPKISGIEILPSTSTPVETAIAAGGYANGVFTADADYTGGGSDSVPVTIHTTGVTDPAPAAVYQSERAGVFTYTIPNLVPNQLCTVRLHFAEFYWTKVGQRQFNVSINGQKVLTNYDIIAAAGAADQANIQQFTTTANSSGQIVIQFTLGAADQPKVSAIEVITSGN